MTDTAKEMVAEFHRKPWTPERTGAFLTKLFAEFDTITEDSEAPGVYNIGFNDGSWLSFDNTNLTPEFHDNTEEPDDPNESGDETSNPI